MPVIEKGKNVVQIKELLILTPLVQASIIVPEKGMVIYNSATDKLNFYTGSAWEAVTSG